MADRDRRGTDRRTGQLARDAARETRNWAPGAARWATAEEVAFFADSADNVHFAEIGDGDLVFVVVADPGGGPASCLVGRASRARGGGGDDPAYAEMDAPDGAAWSHCADDFVAVLARRGTTR